jgi:hypothetical protein
VLRVLPSGRVSLGRRTSFSYWICSSKTKKRDTDHLLDHNFLEDIAKDRKVIPDPIDDRFFISISNGHENIGFFKSWKFEAIDIFS